MSREVRTKEILKETMGGIEDYLEFTVESGEEFSEGWLPTLDTTLKVGESNTIMYKYYEKETTAKTTVHQKSAMEENIKVQILANDVVRRLSNTQEELGSRLGARTITEYGQKLLNSGYQLDQVRSILVKGIKGYESKKLRCKKEGRNFRSTGKESNLKRSKKKLLSKANWYRNRRKEDLYEKSSGKESRKRSQGGAAKMVWDDPKSVLFVEQINKGELGSRIRELLTNHGLHYKSGGEDTDES